jgi:hypothetical protein
MSYRENQRKKAVSQMESVFKDSGNGLFFGKERDFVLSEPISNLWEGIRYDSIDYFKQNKITWWKGAKEEPTGHLLSSQIACINHLYFIRQRKDLATALLINIDSSIQKAELVDDGYVEFEFVGNRDYLNEGNHTRGANCTSVDAVMIGADKSGQRKLFLIEWKYTEDYTVENKYIPKRSKRYDDLICAQDSPFHNTVLPTAYYYEPFYQLMRQTLLGWQCVKNCDHNVSDYLHIHVVPKENKELREKVTSPELKGNDIHDAWKSVLKDSSKFLDITPCDLIMPLKELKDTKSILNYLNIRYWQ